MKEGSENSGIGRENAEFQRLLAGSKCVQVKEVMLLSQPNPEKHRPAKPSGDSGLNTFLAEVDDCGAGRAKRYRENAD